MTGLGIIQLYIPKTLFDNFKSNNDCYELSCESTSNLSSNKRTTLFVKQFKPLEENNRTKKSDSARAVCFEVNCQFEKFEMKFDKKTSRMSCDFCGIQNKRPIIFIIYDHLNDYLLDYVTKQNINRSKNCVSLNSKIEESIQK
jgi:hypothetical protein